MLPASYGVLRGTQMMGMPSPIQWGREKESVARDAYVVKMRNQGHKDMH